MKLPNLNIQNKTVRNWGGALGLILLAGVLAASLWMKPTPEKVSYPAFVNAVESGKVSEVTLGEGATLSFVETNGQTSYITDNPRRQDMKEWLLLSGVSVKEDGISQAMETGLSLLLFGGALFVAYRMTSRQRLRAPMAMESAQAAETVYTRFEAVAGNIEAKESVSDIVDFIRNPEKYQAYGARMPRGMIFYGPPGTGKTLMAKAIAGEAGVPFYAVSGSDFVQLYVGVGAARVRELFKKARAVSKAVIFIDEIDAIGKKRATQAAGGQDEREQTLNALLTEMSGFSTGEGIVVIAATNRLDTLDEALLRPGRFDRQVEISLPDCAARERILRHHAANKPLSPATDLYQLAKTTVFFSGAMLENLLNEAAIFSAKRRAQAIEPADLDKAYYTVIAGSEKLDRSGLREKDRRITAFHEAGHALMAVRQTPENTIGKVTIVPSTKGAGGFCVNIPPDKMYYTKRELESQIMVSYAGRAAEELVFGPENITTGASNDIERATGILRDYVAKYGMGAGGLIAHEAFPGKADILSECRALSERLYSQTKQVLADNMDCLEALAQALLERETLHEEDVLRLTNAAT